VKRTTTRVRGLADWHPQRATRDLLDTIRAVLTEYSKYLPLTLRQLFYRLVGAHGYDKTEKAYGRLGECMNRARRDGRIDFDAIRDDDAEIATRTGWESPHQLIEHWQAEAKYFRLDRQQGQPNRLLIVVEARGMKPQIETVADGYGVPVIGSGGFDSLTAEYDLAGRLGHHDGLTEVLHIGDHDPSGVHLFSSMAEDVQALIGDRGLSGRVQFSRLAVTLDQIRGLSLPTVPPKVTDRRSFEGETVQAEAIAPDVMARIVGDGIESRFDMTAWRHVLDRERRLRSWLSQQLDFIDGNGEAQP
jgi:hypothetical protein